MNCLPHEWWTFPNIAGLRRISASDVATAYLALHLQPPTAAAMFAQLVQAISEMPEGREES